MAKPTPGPWMVQLHAGKTVHGAAIVSAAALVKIATLTRSADKPYDQKAADARLLAAAPDLLDLVFLLGGNLLAVQRTNTADFMVHLKEIIGQADALLARIDGEEAK